GQHRPSRPAGLPVVLSGTRPDHDHRQSPVQQASRHGQADNSGPDHSDVGGRVLTHCPHPPPAPVRPYCASMGLNGWSPPAPRSSLPRPPESSGWAHKPSTTRQPVAVWFGTGLRSVHLVLVVSAPTRCTYTESACSAPPHGRRTLLASVRDGR